MSPASPGLPSSSFTQPLHLLPVLPSGDERDWDLFCQRLSPTLQSDAEACGLFERPQTLTRAHDLLRLLFGYGLQNTSLRELSFWAAQRQIDLTDEALRAKFHRSLDWLKLLVSKHLSSMSPSWGTPLPGVRIRLIDATMLSLPGSEGTDWVLHVTYDLQAGWLVGVELTDTKGAESLSRCQAQAFDIPIGDRAYGLAKHLHHACDRRLFPLVRAQLTSLRVTDAQGRVLTPLQLVQRAQRGDHDQTVEVPYQGRSQTARLLCYRLPPEVAARARQALRKRARKEGQTASRQGLALAGWVVLLTNLPREFFPQPMLLALYRQRWQIELFFKRCRQLLQLGPTKKLGPRLLQVVVWTKVLAMLMLQPQFPEHSAQDGEPRWLWRLTRVLLQSLLSMVWGVLPPEWARWEEKLGERSRKRKRSEQQLWPYVEVIEKWQGERALEAH